MTRKPFLLRGYYGPAYAQDMPHSLCFAIGGRPDLMTRPTDLGRMILAAFDFQMIWGCSPESVMNGRPKWGFSLRARSDIPEIAERLAGGVE